MKRLITTLLIIAKLLLCFGTVNAADLTDLSDWATDEVARGVALGYVPHSIKEDWSAKITRAEYARLSLCFLAVQYGYEPNNNIRTYFVFTGRTIFTPEEAVAVRDKREKNNIMKFIADYCETQTDRNGNPFSYADFNPNYVEGARFSETWWWDSFISDYDGFNDVKGKDAYDNERPFINAAYTFGLINGVGNGLYNPNEAITRQEAAVMLMRVYSKYGGTVPVDADPATFDDSNLIADWAMQAVSDITALGVMQGMEENKFDPLGYYTREQAIVTFLRLYENANVSRLKGNIKPLFDYEKQMEMLSRRSDFELLARYESPLCTVLYSNNLRFRGATVPSHELYLVYRKGGFRHVTNFLCINTSAVNVEPVFDIEIGKDGSKLAFKVYVTDDYNYFYNLGDL